MNLRQTPAVLVLLALATSALAAASPATATEIWPGRPFGFAKASFANPTLPANQDRITPLVWITRGNTQGIYNIAQEAAFTMNVSPKDTRWATGDAVNHASLTFQPWQGWTANTPQATIGVNAVVHLISEDIYIDIVFDAFGGGGTGGAFAYRRGVRPATPTRPTTWGRIKTLYR